MSTKREQKSKGDYAGLDECGWKIGWDACPARFEELLSRDFSDSLFFSTHRLFVDVYALQHPEQFCRSAKSLATHLCDLCAILENGASMATGLEALDRWLDGNPKLEKPPLSAARDGITQGYVAYGELQPWARKLLAAV